MESAQTAAVAGNGNAVDSQPRVRARRATGFQLGNRAAQHATDRDRVQRKFLSELRKDYYQYGRRALELAREADPMGYIRLVASLLPKESIHTEVRRFEGMTDAELLLSIERRVTEYRQVIDSTDLDAATALPDASPHDALTIEASPITQTAQSATDDGSDLAT